MKLEGLKVNFLGDSITFGTGSSAPEFRYPSMLKKEQRQMLEESHPDARIVYATVSAVCDGWRELPNYYKQRDLLGMFYMKDDA